MSAHTPGPWAIHHDGKPLFGAWHIRQDPLDGDYPGATPDLLAALKALVSEIRAYQSPECDDEGALGAIELKAADAAIAKATGEAP
jgi:hypothetical protein